MASDAPAKRLSAPSSILPSRTLAGDCARAPPAHRAGPALRLSARSRRGRTRRTRVVDSAHTRATLSSSPPSPSASPIPPCQPDVWSCPNPEWLCAVAGGYAYLVNTANPQQWEHVEYRPVLAVTPLLSQQLLLFSGHQSLIAYGANGKAWETLRLSWEGIKILEVREASLTGLGWDLMTDQEFDLKWTSKRRTQAAQSRSTFSFSLSRLDSRRSSKPFALFPHSIARQRAIALVRAAACADVPRPLSILP